MPAVTQIQLRLARPEEPAAIAAVLHESFVEFKALYTEAGFSATAIASDQVLLRMSEAPVWVALRKRQLVGTVSAIVKDSAIYIRGMGVLPAERGSGTGSLLLREVESWAESFGESRLFLSTTPFLHSAIRLYERAGFRRINDGASDLFGTPLFTMEKTLSAR
jgi:GNAT superfamily N-acetyltransferase